MRWVRLVPEPKPDGRPYAVDRIDRIQVDGVRYGAALATLTGPIVCLEWDVVVEPDLMLRFERRIQEAPDKPWMAPIRLWAAAWCQREDRGMVAKGYRACDGCSNPRCLPPYVARQRDAQGGDRWASPGEPTVDVISTPALYWPADFLEAAKLAGLASWDYPTTDLNLANFALKAGFAPGRIAWDCLPMHLHW